jgi:hypothetical protein
MSPVRSKTRKIAFGKLSLFRTSRIERKLSVGSRISSRRKFSAISRRSTTILP